MSGINEGTATDPICLSNEESGVNVVMQHQHGGCQGQKDKREGSDSTERAKAATHMSSGHKHPRNPYKSAQAEPESMKRRHLLEEESLNGKASANTKDNGQDAGGQAARSSAGQADNAAVKRQAPIKIYTTRLDEESGRAFKEDSVAYRSTHATLREMLGFDATEHREIRWFVASNFQIDFDFLMKTVPELLSCPFSVFFYGCATSSPEPWRRACTQPDGKCTAHCVRLDPSAPPKSSTNPLPSFSCSWGVHHTKMFLIGYRDGIRVIVHTANLQEGDIHYKTQAAYIQDFPLKQEKSMSASQFEKDLVSYVESYGFRNGHRWDGTSYTSLSRALRRFDFSSAQVLLIPSIPGRHLLSKPPLGHLKLREAIRDYASSSSTSSGPVICQFSSLGSLSVKWVNQFLSSTRLSGPITSSSNSSLQERIKLVYPSVEDIRTSVEGYRGGGSVPGGQNTERAFLQPLFCKWSSTKSTNPFQQNRNVPHIKSYYQLNDDNESMNWFVLASHNMSKAAWGEEQYSMNGRQNVIAHWELGVFLSPQLMGTGPEGRLVPFGIEDDSESTVRIPLPYAITPQPYGPDDKPWNWDAKYSLPDEYGCFGVNDVGSSLLQQMDPSIAAASIVAGDCTIQ